MMPLDMISSAYSNKDVQYGSGGLEIVHKIRWEIHLNPQWKFEWKSTCTIHTFHSPVPATCLIDCVILHNLLPLCTGNAESVTGSVYTEHVLY